MPSPSSLADVTDIADVRDILDASSREVTGRGA